MTSKIIFGINMSHDTACAAVIDGEVKVAIEEERLNGVKHCDGRSPFGRIIPYLSINYCLKHLNITADQVDLWVVNSISPYIIEAFRQQLIGVPKEKIIDLPVPGHHLAHAYSAFYPGSFDEAAILVLDVNGGLHGPNNSKKENYSIYQGKGLDLKPVHLDSLSTGEISVAELYTIYSTILQLSPTEKGDYGKDDPQRSGGKLMGYAAQYFNNDLKKKGSVLDKLRKKQEEEINLEYDKVVMTRDNRFIIKTDTLIKYLKYKRKVNYVEHTFDTEKYFGWKLSKYVHWNYRTNSLKDFENAKFAYEGQLFLEETIVKMANLAYNLTGSENICLAGGSMLNVVACNRILKETPFKHMFVQPAAYDGGNAIGCALYGYYKLASGEQMPYRKKTYTSYLGTQYSEKEVEDAINRIWGLPFIKRKFDTDDEQIEKLVEYLQNEHVVCVFKGRSEFGPRALGNRSFLSNPNKAGMLNFMNEIKGREWYRPVAPIILEESLHEYFDAPFDKAPFMTINAHCKEQTKKLAPAICHVDGSARVQTVSEAYHPFMTKLLRRFAEETGLPPILINTSFNIGGPIVEMPVEAIDTFLRANYLVRALALENYLLELPETDIENV
jgi:carbamoyltransferase